MHRSSCEDCRSSTSVGDKTRGCTCPSPLSRKSSLVKQSPSSSNSTTAIKSYFPPTTSATTTTAQANVTQVETQMNVTPDGNLTLLAPQLCDTVKEENLSYSWALITSPSTNQDTDMMAPHQTQDASIAQHHFFSDLMIDTNVTSAEDNLQHLGFIFHKPTSTQRFLDGQPRVRRRKSANQKRTLAANSTSVTPTNYANNTTRLPVNALMENMMTIDTMDSTTPPSCAVSPHQISSSASSAVEPMDMQFDYLTEQLEILSSTGNTNHHHGFMGDLSNADELTAILNNVLQKDEEEKTTTSSYAGSITDLMSHSGPSTPAVVPKPMMTAPSHCGSFVPRSKCCKVAGTPGGESVVITITPLTNTTENTSMMTMMLEDDTQQKTTTRIVTCYCGAQCTCPGCLVHPSNFFLGSDPYAGLNLPTSSASSSCYGSDEEDNVTKSTTNNHNPFHVL